MSGTLAPRENNKAITIAFDLALNKNARSIILTYNHGLVSDIKSIFFNVSDSNPLIL
jgi:hypothetical protein